MTTNIAKRFALALALVAAAAGAEAAGLSHVGARDPYVDGARSVRETRDVYSEGARSVQEPRSAYSDGARTVAGMDRTGVSADPARTVDPYLDGAYA